MMPVVFYMPGCLQCDGPVDGSGAVCYRCLVLHAEDKLIEASRAVRAIEASRGGRDINMNQPR